MKAKQQDNTSTDVELYQSNYTNIGDNWVNIIRNMNVNLNYWPNNQLVLNIRFVLYIFFEKKLCKICINVQACRGFQNKKKLHKEKILITVTMYTNYC